MPVYLVTLKNPSKNSQIPIKIPDADDFPNDFFLVHGYISRIMFTKIRSVLDSFSLECGNRQTDRQTDKRRVNITFFTAVFNCYVVDRNTILSYRRETALQGAL